MKHIKSRLTAMIATMLMIIGGLSIFPVSADTAGVLTYTLSGTSVTITDCDTSAGNADLKNAFDIIRNSGYTVTSIGVSAFDKCGSLTEIILPETVTDIGARGFRNCSSLISITIPDSVISIGLGGFTACSKLTSIKIPEKLTTLGAGAFSGCTSLTKIEVSQNNTSFAVQNNVLFNKDFTEIVCYPNSAGSNYTIPDSVTIVGTYAFYNCGSLTNITFPANLVRINDFAFYNCSSLNGLNIPENVNYIGNSAFFGCSNITKAVIPEGVTAISDYIFYGCTKLSTLTLPEGLTSIGTWSFYNCDGLHSLSLPKSLKTIGDSAFKYCDVIEEVLIPDGVTSIGNEAFNLCRYLEKLTISASVTTIGTDAFAEVGTSSIYGYSGSYAETYAKNNNFNFIPLEDIPLKEWEYRNENNSAVITKYSGNSSYIEIPNEIDGLTVIGIGDSAFENNDVLSTVTFPDSLISIGRNAFNGCDNLKSATIPFDVSSIDNTAFANCKSLTIYGYSGSYTETYAKSNNISFVALAAPEQQVVIVKLANDGRNEVNINDYKVFIQIFMETPEVTPETEKADVYKDGIINGRDVTAFKRYIIKNSK